MLTINPGITISAGVTLTAQALPLPVSAGLVLKLDAGDPASYPGSGTTWTDTVNSSTFTLYNGVSYGAAGGGHLSFSPAASQYAEGPSLASTLGTWTVEAWLYHDPTEMLPGVSACVVTEVYAGNPINFTLGNTSDSFPSLQTGFFNGGWASNSQGYVISTPFRWYHLVGTWDGSTIKLYVNGVMVDSAPWNYSVPLRGGNGIRLMNRWDVGQYWGGRLALVRIYDNDIGPAGVTQNYNYDLATRFGI